MRKHRNPRPKVSKTAPDHNFEAGTALENLRAEIVDIEALIHAAAGAADWLPAPRDDRQRQVFERIQSLTTKASQQVSASLRYANSLVAALTADLKVRRSRKESESESENEPEHGK